MVFLWPVVFLWGLSAVGFVTDDEATNEAHVSARLALAADDRLARIRLMVLDTLRISPVHHSSRYFRNDPNVLLRVRRQQAGQLGKDESDALDKELWEYPLVFSIRGDGTPSHDLLSFLRVRAICNKAEATEALKQSDQSKRRAELALNEYRASQATSADKSGAQSSSEIFKLPPLEIGFLSDENEVATLGALRLLALEAAESAGLSALTPETLSGLDESDPVLLYRTNTVKLLRLCAASANSALAARGALSS